MDSKNGNGALTYPVGLITLDEGIFAGFNTYYSNTSDYKDTTNYLYTNSYYWTLSPVMMGDDGNANIGSFVSAGEIRNGASKDANGVRPVVSLKPNTLIDSIGDGSFNNPYKVL